MTEIETSFQQAVEAFNASNLDLAIDLFKTTVVYVSGSGSVSTMKPLRPPAGIISCRLNSFIGFIFVMRVHEGLLDQQLTKGNQK